MWDDNFGTLVGFHLIEGVYVICGPLDTGFTFIQSCKLLAQNNVRSLIMCNPGISLNETNWNRASVVSGLLMFYSIFLLDAAL